MNPLILLTGFLTFLFCLIFHIFFWRIRRPKNDIFALFLIFFKFPLLFFAGYFIWNLLNLPVPLVVPINEITAIFILHVSLSSAYIQTYPAAQAISPTLEIMLIVLKYMPQGISQSDILQNFHKKKLTSSRLEDLLNTKLIRQEQGFFTLTPIGKCFINFFVLHRNLLGLKYKGG